jgi:hypothetical protein
VMEHPRYSSDLVPSDYHMVGPLKGVLHGRRFTSDEEVKMTVYSWLAVQPKIFFNEGIRKLLSRWSKCIEKLSDYRVQYIMSLLKIT